MILIPLDRERFRLVLPADPVKVHYTRELALAGMRKFGQFVFYRFQVGKLRDVEFGRQDLLAKLRRQLDRRGFNSFRLRGLDDDFDSDLI